MIFYYVKPFSVGKNCLDRWTRSEPNGTFEISTTVLRTDDWWGKSPGAQTQFHCKPFFRCIKRQQNRMFKFLFKVLFWYHLSFFDVAYIPSSILVLGLKVKPITSRCWVICLISWTQMGTRYFVCKVFKRFQLKHFWILKKKKKLFDKVNCT